jgi:hypothetical protein
MFLSRDLSRSRAGSVLLTSGLTMAGLAVLAGCGSSGSNSAAGTATLTPMAPSSAASSPATSSAQPSWAAALGSGVTVVAPQSVAPGHGSPGAAVTGTMAALETKQAAAFCGYDVPSGQAQCKSTLSQIPSKDLPYATNFALGYVAIDGKKAVVGMTGKYCTPGQSPECFTNNDPAAVFSAEHSFSALWSNALKNSPTSYSLTPCTEIDGKWYIYSSSS